jgi:periplasmic copper chaperone A
MVNTGSTQSIDEAAAGNPEGRRRLLGFVLALAAAPLLGRPATALAHGTRAGDIVIDHPYATPSPPGAPGAVYFRGLSNRGRVADRLISARTPVAESVEIHRSTLDGNVMRMRPIAALELPAGAELRLRHGGDTHLMLVGLKARLEDGQRFTLQLRFERAGDTDVTVWVQTPRLREDHRH